MYLQLPSARWEVRQGHTHSLACSALARCWPCARDTDLGEGEGHSEEPQEEGMLALQARVQGKEAEGAHSAGHSAVPMITHSPQAGGFMRALAITTTICCAGYRQILFLFVSGL